jgi:hypothetical protein
MECGLHEEICSVRFEEEGGFSNDNLATEGTALAPKGFGKNHGQNCMPPLGGSVSAGIEKNDGGVVQSCQTSTPL